MSPTLFAWSKTRAHGRRFRSLCCGGCSLRGRSSAPPPGYIATFEKDTSQFIENVAVHPDHHGEGIGRSLLYFAEQEADDNGLARLYICINVHMIENLDLYHPARVRRNPSGLAKMGLIRVYFEKRSRMNVDGIPYRTIWLADDGWAVEIIDQTKLPHEFAICPLGEPR